MLDNTPNQQSKFRTKNQVEINDDVRGTYIKISQIKFKTSMVSQIKFKTSMLKSSLCDYSDAYIIVKRTITVAPPTALNPNNYDKEVVFKNCAPITDYIIETNDT